MRGTEPPYPTFVVPGEVIGTLYSERSRLVRDRTTYDDERKTLDFEIKLEWAVLKLRVCAGVSPKVKNYTGVNKTNEINEYEMEIRVDQKNFETWMTVANDEYEDFHETGLFDVTRLIEAAIDETGEEFEGK